MQINPELTRALVRALIEKKDDITKQFNDFIDNIIENDGFIGLSKEQLLTILPIIIENKDKILKGISLIAATKSNSTMSNVINEISLITNINDYLLSKLDDTKSGLNDDAHCTCMKDNKFHKESNLCHAILAFIAAYINYEQIDFAILMLIHDWYKLPTRILEGLKYLGNPGHGLQGGSILSILKLNELFIDPEFSKIAPYLIYLHMEGYHIEPDMFGIEYILGILMIHIKSLSKDNDTIMKYIDYLSKMKHCDQFASIDEHKISNQEYKEKAEIWKELMIEIKDNKFEPKKSIVITVGGNTNQGKSVFCNRLIGLFPDLNINFISRDICRLIIVLKNKKILDEYSDILMELIKERKYMEATQYCNEQPGLLKLIFDLSEEIINDSYANIDILDRVFIAISHILKRDCDILILETVKFHSDSKRITPFEFAQSIIGHSFHIHICVEAISMISEDKIAIKEAPKTELQPYGTFMKTLSSHVINQKGHNEMEKFMNFDERTRTLLPEAIFYVFNDFERNHNDTDINMSQVYSFIDQMKENIDKTIEEPVNFYKEGSIKLLDILNKFPIDELEYFFTSQGIRMKIIHQTSEIMYFILHYKDANMVQKSHEKYNGIFNPLASVSRGLHIIMNKDADRNVKIISSGLPRGSETGIFENNIYALEPYAVYNELSIETIQKKQTEYKMKVSKKRDGSLAKFHRVHPEIIPIMTSILDKQINELELPCKLMKELVNKHGIWICSRNCISFNKQNLMQLITSLLTISQYNIIEGQNNFSDERIEEIWNEICVPKIFQMTKTMEIGYTYFFEMVCPNCKPIGQPMISVLATHESSEPHIYPIGCISNERPTYFETYVMQNSIYEGDFNIQKLTELLRDEGTEEGLVVVAYKDDIPELMFKVKKQSFYIAHTLCGDGWIKRILGSKNRGLSFENVCEKIYDNIQKLGSQSPVYGIIYDMVTNLTLNTDYDKLIENKIDEFSKKMNSGTKKIDSLKLKAILDKKRNDFNQNIIKIVFEDIRKEYNIKSLLPTPNDIKKYLGNGRIAPIINIGFEKEIDKFKFTFAFITIHLSARKEDRFYIEALDFMKKY